jgi:hypothetical protein
MEDGKHRLGCCPDSPSGANPRGWDFRERQASVACPGAAQVLWRVLSPIPKPLAPKPSEREKIFVENSLARFLSMPWEARPRIQNPNNASLADFTTFRYGTGTSKHTICDYEPVDRFQ